MGLTTMSDFDIVRSRMKSLLGDYGYVLRNVEFTVHPGRDAIGTHVVYSDNAALVEYKMSVEMPLVEMYDISAGSDCHNNMALAVLYEENDSRVYEARTLKHRPLPF